MTSASDRLIRRITWIVAAGGIPILLLLLGLALIAYAGARRDVLESHRQAAITRQAGLEQLVSVTRHHVAVMHDFLLHQLGRQPPPSTTLEGLLDGPHPGPSRGLVASLPGTLDAPGVRERLGAAEALFPLLQAAHTVLPQLRWSYVFDAERRFIMAYPFTSASELWSANADMAAGYRSWFDYDVFQNATPERNPQRSPFWTPAYVDAGGAGLVVSHAIPVDIDGQFRAMVGADLQLASFSTYLHRFASVEGRFAVADQNGTVLADPDTGATVTDEHMVTVRQLIGHDRPALATPDGFHRVGSDHLLALDVAGTPWMLLHTVPEDVVRRTALADTTPYFILAAGLLTALLGLHAALSRQFIRPAARLAAFVEHAAVGLGEAMPRVPRPWQPSFRQVAAATAEQRRLTIELQEAESLKSAVLDAALDAVVIANQEGRIIGFNSGAERIFGLRSAQALGCRVGDLIVPEQMRAAHEAGMARMQETGEARVLGRRMEVEALRTDGAVFPAEIAIHRVQTEARTVFAAYLRDLTAEREAAAALEVQRSRLHQAEKLSAMGSLLAGVAHELNNPLGILLVQAALLRDKAESPDLRRRAERIYAAAERSGRIVKSFLAMARQEAPRHEAVQVNEAIIAAIEMTAYGARSADIRVEATLDPALPLVTGDRDLLCQVAANLLINAQQVLMERARPRHVHVHTTADGTDGVVMEVADNGPGVPDAIAAKIFDPYFTTKPVGAGTGIGLAICRDVVTAHGGSIAVDKAPGGGALFRVRLPASRGTNDRSSIIATEEHGPWFVVVVDDEPDMATGLAEIIQGLGHRVMIAESPAAVVERATREPIDVVFADLRMPGMDGAELRRRLELDQPGLGARTVIVTGDTVLGTGFLPNGVIVLEKPFSLESVQVALRRTTRR